MRPVTFALFFGNRSLFPETLIGAARREMRSRLEELGYGVLMMPADATPLGAVETAADGAKYARWLAGQRAKADGVIVSLANFGDETGAAAALKEAGVPILLQAYPDELDKMGPSQRRDAFCGKFSIMDVFCQYGIPFTALKPHTVHPRVGAFAENVAEFARICRVTNGMREFTVGAVGARTTAFKTVRFDELALQRHGITTETYDLSMIISRVRGLADGDPRVRDKVAELGAYADLSLVPPEPQRTLARLAVVLEELVAECRLDALALRCWSELETELQVAPCVVAGLLGDCGVPCACEVDVCNAVAMRALALASDRAATCLDWNNNYGDDPDKCILFHCGPVPQSLMAGRGQVADHPILARALGPGCGWGPNVGRIAASPITYGSCKTDRGRLSFFLGQGEITGDPIAADFFGCAGVARIEGLQDKLLKIGQEGYRHHVSLTAAHVEFPLREAFTRYLGYELADW